MTILMICPNLSLPEVDSTIGHGLSRDARGVDQLWFYLQKMIYVYAFTSIYTIYIIRVYMSIYLYIDIK